MSTNERCCRCGAIGDFGRYDSEGPVCDDCFQQDMLGAIQEVLSKREMPTLQSEKNDEDDGGGCLFLTIIFAAVSLSFYFLF